MWQQTYSFAGDSLLLSAAVSALPLLVLFYLLGIRRAAGWQAALAALATTIVVAIGVVGMPVGPVFASVVMGAGFGLFPISWIVFSSLLLYRITVETGQFDIIKASLGALTTDRRLQLLLVGFGFSAFIEGSAGFGSPVAVSAAMLTGLGFPAFYAALLCLVGNTAPVAFGSIGIPILTLGQTTGLPVEALSAMTGRLLAPIAVVVPAYLVVIMAGPAGAAAVWPAIAVTGLTFGAVQFGVSNYIGPELTDILAALATVGALVVLMRVWRPRETFRLPGETAVASDRHGYTAGQVARAWLPYALLVVFVLSWGYAPVKATFDTWTYRVPMPGLHNVIERMPPVTAAPAPVRRHVHTQLAQRCRHRVRAGLRARRVRPRSSTGAAGVDVRGHVAPARVADAHHRQCPRDGVPDELRRHDVIARPGVCRHGCHVPVLQRAARLAGRRAHGQRHLVECALRQPAGGHGPDARAEHDPDGVHQRRRRGDGQDVVPAESGRRRVGDKHARGRRVASVSRVDSPQPGARRDRRRARARVCLRGSRGGARAMTGLASCTHWLLEVLR